MDKRRLGIAVIGLGGAVGSTMVAGIELIRKGLMGYEGLPLADSDPGSHLAAYEDIVIGGWDLCADDLANAAAGHEVLTLGQFAEVRETLSSITPWKATANKDFLANIEGENLFDSSGHRETIVRLHEDLRAFKSECDDAVVINLASTERLPDEDSGEYSSLGALEAALDANSSAISPAMLYAYAAISEGIPYGNFTPSLAADIPALLELADKNNVPVAGKDGKTGQTFIKAVLASALKARALKVEGWYSTNILGNRDGLALSNEDSLRSKVKTKHSILRNILGYEVEDHIVDIRYYRPRGDNKEAWDNIDFVGFLGMPMQMKVNFLCRDSILAAPLAIEIARCLALASNRGEAGVQEQLAVFFKSPMAKEGEEVEQAFHKQEAMLEEWLAS